MPGSRFVKSGGSARLYFDTRWFGDHGIGRFARETHARLDNVHDLAGSLAPASALDPLYLSYRAAFLPKRSFFFSPGFSAPMVSRVPFAFTIHDLNHIDFEGARTVGKSVYYETVMKPACRKARVVFTVSEYSRSRIAAWSGLDPLRIINVGNGVLKLFSPDGARPPSDRPYVLCVGNRKPHKNEIRTLEAFSKIASAIPHDLVFTGIPSQALQSAMGRLSIAERIRFAGRLTDDALACLYRGASALVFASLQEGFGLPVIEAMACGTPVITSNLCSLPEVAGGAAILVDPYSLDEIASALQRLLTDNEMAVELVQRGLVNAARYSWDKTGLAVRTVLEEQMT